MGTHWTEIPLFIIDFEGHASYGVVEYGVVRMEGGTVRSCETRICRPHGRIRAEDVDVHGISGDAAASTEVFECEFERFSAMRREGVFGAHHQIVENGFLKRSWAYPPFARDWSQNGRMVASWGPWIDTLLIFGAVFPSLESHKLGDLVRTFQLQDELDAQAQLHCPEQRSRYHCAGYDALASALLLKRLSEFEGFEEMSLEWLLEQSRRTGRESQIDLFE